jgi:hypothetical protein
VLVLGFGYVGVRGYVDLQRAPGIFGIYDVSWNQTEAWQAAARSRVPAVFTLDWGVFYPGVVNSRASQRWEMTEVDGPERLLSLNFGRSAPEIGLLFRAAGPHRWLLGAANDGQTYSVVEQALFDRHPGEKWVFLVVNTAGRRQVGPVPEAPVDNLVRNPLFRQGELYWRYEKWEKEPGRVDYDIVPCDGGPEQTCARLKHPVEGDSRLVQEIELPADSVYEVSALAKATGVGEASKGAYLCLMDGLAESGELRGDTDWHQLRFYVATRDRPRRIRLAARLGTFGQVNVGSAWFTDLRVQRVAAAPPGAKVYDLARGS